MIWACLRRSNPLFRLLTVPLGLLLLSGVLALVTHAAGRVPPPVAVGLGIAQNSTRLLGWGLLFVFLILFEGGQGVGKYPQK